MTDAAQIADRPERHRYELTLGGNVAAKIVYRPHGEGVVELIHTEVEPAHEGQGLASKLVRFALDDLRAQGKRVIATCEYVVAWMRKHPEYQDLLARPLEP